MTNRTQLMSAEIVDGAVLAAWLVKPDNGPEAVLIMWPDQPTSVSPRHYGDLVARVTRLLANSSTELAAINAGRRAGQIIKPAGETSHPSCGEEA